MTFLVGAALQRPHTFVVMSPLITVFGLGSITTIPHDIFPAINIPVVNGTYYLWAVVHHSVIVMGTEYALGLKRAHKSHFRSKIP
jgi:hypothetical protein